MHFRLFNLCTQLRKEYFVYFAISFFLSVIVWMFENPSESDGIVCCVSGTVSWISPLSSSPDTSQPIIFWSSNTTQFQQPGNNLGFLNSFCPTPKLSRRVAAPSHAIVRYWEVRWVLCIFGTSSRSNNICLDIYRKETAGWRHATGLHIGSLETLELHQNHSLVRILSTFK